MLDERTNEMVPVGEMSDRIPEESRGPTIRVGMSVDVGGIDCRIQSIGRKTIMLAVKGRSKLVSAC